MIAKLERVLTLLFILAAVLLLLPHLVRAAGWAERYGLTYSRLGFPVMTADGGEAVTETGDQGLLLAGWTTYDLASGGGTWVVKTGAGGAIQWQYAYLTPGVDRFLGADQAADGGYYLVGQTTSWGYGDNDGWVVKLDGAGAVQWQKAFGGTNWDELRSVAATADGGCLAVGYSYSFLTGQADTTTAWLLKLDSGGNVQWQKAFGDTTNGSAALWDVKPTADGGCVAAGAWVSTGAETGYGWLVKLGSDGSIQWQTAVGDRATLTAYYFRSVAVTPDGGYFCAGQAENQDEAEADYLAARFDSSGALRWVKALHRPGLYDEGKAAAAGADGGLIIGGQTGMAGSYEDQPGYGEIDETANGAAGLVKLDDNGNILWAAVWEGSGYPWLNNMTGTADSGAALIGSVSDSQGFSDMFLVRADANGQASSACPAGALGGQSVFTSLDSGAEVITPTVTAISAGPAGTPTGAGQTATNNVGCSF